MLLISLLLFPIGGQVLAAKWTIDGSCDLVHVTMTDKWIPGPFPTIEGATQGIKDSMIEGITMAENAFNAMNDHANDQHVSDMLRLLLGEGVDYQSKFDSVKRTFENIKSYEKEPSASRPLDKDWQDTMTFNDVMRFCSLDRFQAVETTQLYVIDTASKNNRKRQSHVALESKLVTVRSDLTDWQGLAAAPVLTRRREDFEIPQPGIAFTIDFCNWFLDDSNRGGWPTIDKDLIAKTQQDRFKGGVTDLATPVDGLRKGGLSALHELTHTHPSRLVDIQDLPRGIDSCYGWKCVQALKDPKNADNVAMLGLALHLWTLGYYVDKDGNVKDK